MYFAGCTASFVEKDIAEATVRLLTDAGYERLLHGRGRGLLRHSR